MGEAEKASPNFILVPMMTPREVVSLLLGRFPAMRDLVCPDEDCFNEPTRVYDSFAPEVVRKVDDRELFKSVIRFIDDIAESKDPLLSTVLVISLLEGIAADPDVARRVSSAVGETARMLLRDVERKIYHRMNT
jgi:hypothetical protein